MKQCNKCGQMLELSEFGKDKTRPDGYSYTCKPCKKVMPSQKRGTLQYFMRRTWWELQKRTVNGSYPTITYKNKSYHDKGIRLEMSKEEFYKFCESNKTVILQMYMMGDTPSLDRIDSAGHYSLDNIQILTLKANSVKGDR